MPRGKIQAAMVSRSPRVLIVDDAMGMRTYLRTLLAAVGFACVEATQGREALEYLLFNDVDLVITDLDMPVMNGFELLAAITLLPALRRPPVIVVSARLDECDVERRPELRTASAFLEKPATVGLLMRAVNAALGASIQARMTTGVAG